MNKYLACTLSAVFCLGTLNVAQAAPQAFQASYSVEYSGLSVGTMQSSLSYTNNTYTFQKLAKANGLAAMLSGNTINERSSGLKQGNQLQTQSYLYDFKSKRKARKDQFTMNANKVNGTYEDKPYSLNVPANTTDPILVELKLMDDLAANRALTYQVTEKGKLKTYQFKRLGKEKISVPAGDYTAEKIQLVRDDDDRQTTFWMAAELGYLPVQAQHNEKGDLVTSRLLKVQMH